MPWGRVVGPLILPRLFFSVQAVILSGELQYGKCIRLEVGGVGGVDEYGLSIIEGGSK